MTGELPNGHSAKGLYRAPCVALNRSAGGIAENERYS
jgi:hypothetical protein